MKKCFDFIFVLLIFAFLSACDSGDSRSQVAGSGAEFVKESVSYALSDREKHVFSYLLAGDIDVYAVGGDSAGMVSLIVGEHAVVAADALQKEYERNEVAGDKKFRGRLLFVEGEVKSIDRSIGENYFITLKGGGNPFVTPKARMADGFVDYLAELEKGRSIQLVCEGGGMLLGSAMLSDCQPLNVFSLEKAKNFVSNLDIGDGASLDKSVLKLLVYSVALASNLKDSSSCLAVPMDQVRCGKEVGGLFKDELEAKESLKAAVEKMGLPSSTPNAVSA